LQIQIYDFLAHGIFSDYNGLLGLDFFEGTKFCIDMKENTIYHFLNPIANILLFTFPYKLPQINQL